MYFFLEKEGLRRNFTVSLSRSSDFNKSSVLFKIFIDKIYITYRKSSESQAYKRATSYKELTPRKVHRYRNLCSFLPAYGLLYNLYTHTKLRYV